MRYLVVVVLLLALAAGATFYRYGSLSPCVWIERDMARGSGLPELAIQAQIKARFLLEGITDPGPGECLLEWWRLRREGVQAAER